jgi:Tfp pilus assembly pilus retraction ATPase PilT
MAGVLRGVISQRLLPKVDGGRVAAVEVMVMNARIADLVREGRPDEITDAIAEGEFFQMQTFTNALIEHVLTGRVESEVAANAATNRHDFLVELEQAIKRRRAADVAARMEEGSHHQVEQPEALAAPTLKRVSQDEGPGLRIVPAG